MTAALAVALPMPLLTDAEPLRATFDQSAQVRRGKTRGIHRCGARACLHLLRQELPSQRVARRRQRVQVALAVAHPDALSKVAAKVRANVHCTFGISFRAVDAWFG